jgi:hypothetical protein
MISRPSTVMRGPTRQNVCPSWARMGLSRLRSSWKQTCGGAIHYGSAATGGLILVVERKLCRSITTRPCQHMPRLTSPLCSAPFGGTTSPPAPLASLGLLQDKVGPHRTHGDPRCQIGLDAARWGPRVRGDGWSDKDMVNLTTRGQLLVEFQPERLWSRLNVLGHSSSQGMGQRAHRPL